MAAPDPFEYLFSLEQFGVKLGLDTIRSLLDALGRPQDAFLSLHVAGTNGKGSVCAMAEAMLRAAGLRTGRFTSPHLVRLTERFAIDGGEVTEWQLRNAVLQVVTAVHALQEAGALDVHPTFFEVTTAAAFVLFRDHGVDVAVVEVGLGGRLDSTNVLTPVATAITSIGFDHQQYLGSTIESIAAEKAGIIKPGVPVVIGELPPAAEAVITDVAAGREAPLVRSRDGVAWTPSAPDADGRTRLHLTTPRHEYRDLTLGLRGDHQVGNAVVAVRLIEECVATMPRVDASAVRTGLRNVSWPGRLQRITVDGGRTALLDAAHNPDGAATLAAYLRRDPPRPLVFAAMRDKDADGILRALAGTVSAVVVTRASHPRSAEPTALATIARQALAGIPCTVADVPAEALQAAWRHAPEIVVAGSIFLLGDVIEALSAT